MSTDERAATAPRSPAPWVAPLGEQALVVVFGRELSIASNERACRFAQRLADAALPYVIDIVPSFVACTVHYRAAHVPAREGESPYECMAARLQSLLLEEASAEEIAPAPVIEIPVCYGGEWGPDLEEAAQRCGVSTDALVRMHTDPQPLRVFMLGFLPGAPYIGVHDARMQLPRRDSPRTHVPAGSIGIANRQSVIYPETVPGGWNLIGRTPLRVFDRTRAPPALLAPGTQVRFRAIDTDEFHALAAVRA